MNRIVLVLIAIVLLGIAAFAALWFRVGDQLQDLADDVLVAWREGRADAVYDDATNTFREGRTREQFHAYLAHWSDRLGGFVKVDRRTEVSTSSNERETLKGVTLVIDFERGTAEGRFEFRVVDDALKLLHLSLRVPGEPQSRDDRAQLEGRARTLFDHYDAQAFVELYAALSSDLQRAWPPATLVEQLRAMHAQLGSIESASVQTTKHEADDRHVIVFALTFKRGSGTAEVEWRWSSERWNVVGFGMKSAP